MKKIYTEKIHQSTRFGLIDEDGRKTPCGTLWSDAQRETFERLIMNGGNTSLSDMIKNVKKGLIMNRFSAGSPGVNGDVTGVAKNSFLIEDGKIVGAVSETMFSGNLTEMLLNVRAISEERINDGSSILPWVDFGGVTISGK